MSLAVLIVVATTRSCSTLPGEAGMGELDKDVPSIPDRAPAGPGSSGVKDPDACLAPDRAVISTRWGSEFAGRPAQPPGTHPHRSRPPVTRAPRPVNRAPRPVNRFYANPG